MNIRVKKLAIVKDKKAFTLLELTVSLFLLIILTLLLMLIIQTTMMTSKRFLDYSNVNQWLKTAVFPYPVSFRSLCKE